MKEIKLQNGKVAIVDDDDFVFLSKYKWFMDANGYVVVGAILDNGKRQSIYMHRLLMGLGRGDKMKVDHVDGVKHDNRRENLRVCTHAENIRNKRHSKNNTSGYKGVHFCKARKKWTAAIKLNYKTIMIGRFENPGDAYAAYCKKAKELHGEFANFGETK